jgi:hypothetical protein
MDMFMTILLSSLCFMLPYLLYLAYKLWMFVRRPIGIFILWLRFPAEYKKFRGGYYGSTEIFKSR